MLCGINQKTGRCMQVKNKNDTSLFCEENKTVNQKRCRRKTERKPKSKPKPNPRPGRSSSSSVKEIKYKCPPDKIYNHKTKRCIQKTGVMGKKIMISSKTTQIGGPVSLDYYKVNLNGIERKILLFGDEHTQYIHHKQPDTIEITTLLKKIIRKSPHCIDLYSENAPINIDLKAKGKAIQKYSSPLEAVRKEFGNCPKHNLKGFTKCNYDNLRYHNWDLRFQVQEKGGWRSNPYDELLFKHKSVFNELNNKFSKVSIIKYLLGFPVSNSKSIDSFFKKKLEFAMKRESFQKAVSPTSIFSERRELIQKEYKKCLQSTTFPKDLLKTFISSYKALRDTDYTLVFTDFYTLCRMFMKFDSSRSKMTPKRCPVQGKNNYQTPQYLIVFAGHMHILNLIGFIEKMFGEKPIYTTGWKRGNKIFKNKILSIESPFYNIKDSKGKKLQNVNTIDDLFTDFY